LSVGRKRNRNSIKDVVSQISLLRVESSDEERSTWVADRDTLTLHVDPPFRDYSHQDIGKLCVKEVDVVHVQDSAVRLAKNSSQAKVVGEGHGAYLRKKPRLENGLSEANRLFHIDRSQQTVFHNVEGNLDERAGNNFGLLIFDLEAFGFKPSGTGSEVRGEKRCEGNMPVGTHRHVSLVAKECVDLALCFWVNVVLAPFHPLQESELRDQPHVKNIVNGTSIGGMMRCRARAMTDLAVPRPPKRMICRSVKRGQR
jgi:hypothetical protein